MGQTGAAVLSALLLAGSQRQGLAPWRLAIYYGYPSLVNGARGDRERAVSHFSEYDLLVLGDGLEFDSVRDGSAGPAEHEFSRQVIERLRTTPRRPAVFGYVDLGLTQQLAPADVIDRIDRWAAMGAQGILFDEAGYDFGVTRERQNDAVRAAHNRGLRALLNAFDPNDLLSDVPTSTNAAGGGNPGGIAPVLSAGDGILLESFGVKGGVPEPIEQLMARGQSAVEGRRRFGLQLFAVATAGAHGDDEAMARYGWWCAALFGFDGYGWGGPAYGAATSQLPRRSVPDAEGFLLHADFLGEPLARPNSLIRATTVGSIVVEPGQRYGTLVPR